MTPIDQKSNVYTNPDCLSKFQLDPSWSREPWVPELSGKYWLTPTFFWAQKVTLKGWGSIFFAKISFLDDFGSDPTWSRHRGYLGNPSLVQVTPTFKPLTKSDSHWPKIKNLCQSRMPQQFWEWSKVIQGTLGNQRPLASTGWLPLLKEGSK